MARIDKRRPGTGRIKRIGDGPQCMRDDDGKLHYDLIPTGPLAELANVYTQGSKKYADHNWRKGTEWSRAYAALQRHANKFWSGEDRDPELQQHHLASVAFWAFALMEWGKTHKELDDRYEK